MHLFNDKNRLDYLKNLDLLNTNLNTDFDELTELASQICQMPICVLSFFGDLNIYSKSAFGVPRTKLSISNSICQNLVSNDLETLVINDMSEYDFSEKNISKTDFDFEFYTGVKLKTSSGITLGTLCVLDKKPNQISEKKLKYLQTIAKQITAIIELKASEIDSKIKSEKLQKNANLYHDFIEKMPVDGILWEADAELFKNTYVSPQAEKILGFEAQRWIDEEDFWENHIHPEDRDWAVEYCKNEVKHRRNHIFTYRMLTKDGDYKWMQDRVLVIENEKQDLILRGIMLDVTQQRQYEIQLSQQQSFNRDIIKNLPSILFLFDKNQNFLKWNDKLEKVSGYSSCEIQKMKPLDFFDLEAKGVIQKHIKKVISKGQTSVEANLFTKHQDLIPHQFSASTIYYKGEKCIIGSAVDISETATQSEIESTESKLLTNIINQKHKLKNSLDEYLEDLENTFPEMHISIQNIENEKIRPVSSPSMPKPYLEKINGVEIGKNVGSCGAAAFLGKTIIAENIDTDENWKNFKQFLLPYGYQSCWSTPIFGKNKKVISTFAIYYKTPKKPTKKELFFFKRSASLLGVIFQNQERQEVIKNNLKIYKYVNLATKDVIFEWQFVQFHNIVDGNLPSLAVK
ncbi:MAG: PAS domain-containing protein [Psychroflexus sp.]